MNLGVAQAQLGQLDEAEASYKVSLISEVDCFNRIFYGHHVMKLTNYLCHIYIF